MRKLYKHIPMVVSALMVSSLCADEVVEFEFDVTEGLIADNSDNKKNSTSSSFSSKKKKNTQEDYDQFTIFGDFLYWRADVEGAEFAERGPVSNASATSPSLSISGKTVQAEGKWEPGVRAGIGYKFSHFDDWDLSLVWTHLNAKSKPKSVSGELTAISPGAVVTLVGPIGPNILGPEATEASGGWKFNTNMIDLDLGREYKPSKNLCLKPHVGLRGAWFKYDFSESFSSFWSSFAGDDPIPSTREIFTGDTYGKNSFDFKGIGLKLGLDNSWHLSKQWTIEGRFSASLLSGRYNVKQSYSGFYASGIDNGLGLFVPIEEAFSKVMWRVRTNIEGFLGFQWKMLFDEDKRSFFLSAGYEFSQWFQLNEVPTIIDTDTTYIGYTNTGDARTINNLDLKEFSTHGDVSFQGLTVRAGFDF